MNKITFILSLLAGATAFSQQKSSFFDEQIMGKTKAESPIQLSLDAYPFLFLANGGGGTASIEFRHWQVGMAGFSVVPPDYIVNTFFRQIDTKTVTVRRNSGLEVFANYYLRPDRKGVYAGLLGGPEWFVMNKRQTDQQETLIKTYIVPRLGIRVFPVKKYVYADASLGWSFNLSGTESRTIGQSVYSASTGGFIYFLQIGARFNLAKQR